MDTTTILLDLGITFLQQFLISTGQKIPSQVVAAIQAAIDALSAHKDDLLTKANFEAQRG